MRRISIPINDHEPDELTSGLQFNRRASAQRDAVWPDVYDALPASSMKRVSQAIELDDPRKLVTVRDMLAGAFLDQLRAIAADPERDDVSARREDLNQLIGLISRLRNKYGETLANIIKDHREADWHKPVSWGPSDYRYDYEQLLDGPAKIERICNDILQSPAFNLQKTKERGLTGLPAKLSDQSGTWAKEAFAIRLARIFWTVTGNLPTVSGSQATRFQRFAKVCDELFQKSYRKLDHPFGQIEPLTTRDLRKASRRYKKAGIEPR